MEDLRAVLIRLLIERAFETGTPRRECACSDIVRKQLLVDDIDNGRDERFYVFRTSNERIDIGYYYDITALAWEWVYVSFTKETNCC